MCDFIFFCFSLLQQAQRRELEEQYAANPPIKSNSGIAISAPPTATPKKAAKILPPTREKPPQVIPISAPAVEPPKFEPQPVVKEEAAEAFVVEVAAADDGVLLEQATVELESRVGDEVEGPARVAKEAAVESIPPAEPSMVEADLAKEAEVPVSETEPVSEVIKSFLFSSTSSEGMVRFAHNLVQMYSSSIY